MKMARGLLWKYFEADLVIVYIHESAENGEDFDGKWRDALLWKVF